MNRILPLLLLALAACTNGVGVVLLPASAFRVLSPSDGGAANGAPPVVQWTLVQGAATYELSVYRDAAHTDLADRCTVTAGSATAALADGEEYYAVVRALAPDGSEVARGEVRFKVVGLPPLFPGLEVVVHDEARAQGGYKLFNLFAFGSSGLDQPPTLALVNAFGEVVWWFTHPEPGGISDARVLPNGNLLYIRGGGDQNGPFSTAFEMTWDGAIVWQSRPDVQVHHEIGIGPGDNYLYLTFVFDDYQGVTYEGDGIELVDPATGQIVWDWNMFDHFDPADFQVPEIADPGRSGGGVDWSHSNAVVWDEARSLIWVSVRHFDRIIGIDYPSGAVRVTLGAGGLGGPDAMRHQHAPEVQDDGQILFFDNGNGRLPQETRVVVADFDETTGAYAETFVWKDDPPFYDRAVGDADRQPNGNILVTAGASSRLVEITPGGTIVWDLRIDPTAHFTYRSDQVPEDRIGPGVLPFDDD